MGTLTSAVGADRSSEVVARFSFRLGSEPSKGAQPCWTGGALRRWRFCSDPLFALAGPISLPIHLGHLVRVELCAALVVDSAASTSAVGAAPRELKVGWLVRGTGTRFAAAAGAGCSAPSCDREWALNPRQHHGLQSPQRLRR